MKKDVDIDDDIDNNNGDAYGIGNHVALYRLYLPRMLNALEALEGELRQQHQQYYQQQQQQQQHEQQQQQRCVLVTTAAASSTASSMSSSSMSSTCSSRNSANTNLHAYSHPHRHHTTTNTNTTTPTRARAIQSTTSSSSATQAYSSIRFQASPLALYIFPCPPHTSERGIQRMGCPINRALDLHDFTSLATSSSVSVCVPLPDAAAESDGGLVEENGRDTHSTTTATPNTHAPPRQHPYSHNNFTTITTTTSTSRHMRSGSGKQSGRPQINSITQSTPAAAADALQAITAE